MGEEIAFANGRISDFQGFVTMTLTLDRVILHTVVHHSSTSTYIPNVIEIKETFCGRTVRTYGRRTFETDCIRSTSRSRPKKSNSVHKHGKCLLKITIKHIFIGFSYAMKTFLWVSYIILPEPFLLSYSVFVFSFSLFFRFCALRQIKLAMPSHQLLSTCKSTVSYHIVLKTTTCGPTATAVQIHVGIM